ncbi:MAG: hypothetical protein AUH89_01325 [Ktedonobacter sp. 13_1_40CM_4_52_4]|nr:MAG: hypothetical protein AUH89_01325 [Ktedonobacter sp. 13_1_40CM_4_52_4]
MQKYRRMLRRRATFLLIDWLVVVVCLTVWMVTREPVPTKRTIHYNRASDHILVQLAKLPEHPGAQMRPEPMWTLYGDGTLIFQTDLSDNLWRAQLSPGAIQHILDVIINQNTFFDSTAQRYGRMTPERDDGELLLIVDAYGQQKEVVLVSEPTNQVAIDIQATHVSAIEQFLLDYHPLHTVLYASNPDPDGVSDDGK